jgi:hypothetical protein
MEILEKNFFKKIILMPFIYGFFTSKSINLDFLKFINYKIIIR